MIVTIAICTWNRARLLEKTLAQMCCLRIPAGVELEILVVNNNSGDDTDAVIARYTSRLPLRGLHESRPGKSYAANLALTQATGQLLLWTDDDVLVDPDWLAAYVQAASDWPQASFFAGAIRPWFEKEPPWWVRHHLHRLKGVYVLADYGNEVRPWGPSDGVYGANMAFRMDVARQFPLNPELGRIQGHLIGGDDTELVRAAWSRRDTRVSGSPRPVSNTTFLLNGYARLTSGSGTPAQDGIWSGKAPLGSARGFLACHAGCS